MFSKTFIDRPIFAMVLSILIVIIGGVSLLKLPIAQYPEIAPPTIQVTANYAGANAQVVADTVAAPIEQQVNGVENMLYMSSQSTNDGAMNLTVTFRLGTNLDMAQVLVQNRVSIANASLPPEVKQVGVTTKKKSPNILLAINLVSKKVKDPISGEDTYKYDQLFLSNYASINIKDTIARIPGVGDVTFLGPRDYSMRIWLDPNKLKSRNMTAADIKRAVQQQNQQVAAGRLGQPPSPDNIFFQLPINVLGRLTKPEQFGDMVIKVGSAGELTYLRDVVLDRISEISIDKDKLKQKNLTIEDINAALKKRQTPIVKSSGGGLRIQLNSQGQKPESLVLDIERTKTQVSLSELLLDEGGIKEVQKGIELGAKNYDVNTYLDGEPSVMMAVFQLPGGNALETAKGIRKAMEDLKKDFPEGVEYRIVYDTTVFIKESISSVVHTLVEAFILVFIVVLFFLQDWRSTVMPMIAVPVSLIGTFSVMAMLGFSLNNLSLFGLVLAIGIVVDDAIVVIENVEVWMSKGLSPKEASIKAMEEVTGPVVAIALVLTAVFVPTVFMAGISGQFYQQFALTVAASTIISAFNALTLTPAMCAIILKEHKHGEEHGQKEALPKLGVAFLGALLLYLFLSPPLLKAAGIEHEGPTPTLGYVIIWGSVLVGGVGGWFLSRLANMILGFPLRGFNLGFDKATAGYGKAIRLVVRISLIMIAVYAGLMVLTVMGFKAAPTGFIPQQDKGYLVANAQLQDGANLGRTEKVMRQMTAIALSEKGVKNVLTMVGYSVITSTNLPNVGGMFIVLEPFEERAHDKELSADNIMLRLRDRYRKEIEGEDALAAVFGAPPVDGLGSTGGFKVMVQDKGSLGPQALQGAVTNVAAKGNLQQGKLVGLFSSFTANQPQLFIDIDRVKAQMEKVSVQDVFETLQTYIGSFYVNDITLYSRNWQVVVQAGEQYRQQPKDIGLLEVRNAEGKMVPLGTMVSYRYMSGPAIVNRYNTYPAAEVNGNTAPGFSSGDSILLMNKIMREELPKGMGSEWTELTYQQILAGEDMLTKLVFPLSILFVFLVLAAQYESWSLPMAIIMIVPMCMLAAIGGVLLNGMDNNIFTQIGLVVLVGLASKNAILVVEFAKEKEEKDKLSPFEAAILSARLRLRPILMTAFAFILGVVPLMLAKGAGAEMRVALGVAVFYGMLGVTIFGLFFTPVFYYVIRWLSGHRGQPETPAAMVMDSAPPPADGTKKA